MKIKSGLVYNRHSGKIVGFSVIGDINNELFEFQQRVENKIDTKPIATHVLTFMVRGLCTSLTYSFVYYAANGFTSDQLFSCIWEAVKMIETIGLKVSSQVMVPHQIVNFTDYISLMTVKISQMMQ